MTTTSILVGSQASPGKQSLISLNRGAESRLRLLDRELESVLQGLEAQGIAAVDQRSRINCETLVRFERPVSFAQKLLIPPTAVGG